MKAAIGTNGNDILKCNIGYHAAGMGGDDILETTTRQSIPDHVLFGGTGNDTYLLGNDTSTVINDVHGYDVVKLNMSYNGMYFDGMVLDNNFLYIRSQKYNTIVILVDYLNPESMIECFEFNDTSVSFEQILDLAKSFPRYYSSDSNPIIQYISPLLYKMKYFGQQLLQAENTVFGFNEQYYDVNNVDVANAIDMGIVVSGGQHYINAGIKEGRSPNAAYNENYYLARNHDVAFAVRMGWTTGYEHFINYGQYEGRQGSAEFNSGAYLDANPDVAAAVQQGRVSTAFNHYATWGQFESRQLKPTFSEAAYIFLNQDVDEVVNSEFIASGNHHYDAFEESHERQQFGSVHALGVTDLSLKEFSIDMT